MRTIIDLHSRRLGVSGAAFMGWPGAATAQGGGTVEVEVKYNGAAMVDKLKVNKDTEKCGTEATIEKVVVGPNKGLSNAVVSVAGAGQPMPKSGHQSHGCVRHTVEGPGEIEPEPDDILHNIHTY
jgi:hypothetical protein